MSIDLFSEFSLNDENLTKYSKEELCSLWSEELNNARVEGRLSQLVEDDLLIEKTVIRQGRWVMIALGFSILGNILQAVF